MSRDLVNILNKNKNSSFLFKKNEKMRFKFQNRNMYNQWFLQECYDLFD